MTFTDLKKRLTVGTRVRLVWRNGQAVDLPRIVAMVKGNGVKTEIGMRSPAEPCMSWLSFCTESRLVEIHNGFEVWFNDRLAIRYHFESEPYAIQDGDLACLSEGDNWDTRCIVSVIKVHKGGNVIVREIDTSRGDKPREVSLNYLA